MSFLVRINLPPSCYDVQLAANIILESKGKPQVHKDQARRQLKRNKIFYYSLRTKTLAAERKAVHNLEEIQAYFDDFKAMLIEFNIRQCDVWNFDEIGFRIGCLKGRVVIVPADVKAIYLADPDNRESITALECISAGGKSIQPMILMKGKVIIDKHVHNKLYPDVVIGCTPTGFTNDVYTFEWLQSFDQQTKASASGRWRALIMDGHGSYVSEHFKHYYWHNKIVPFLLPAHSTHLLQPADVGVFSSMKQYHQNELYESIRFGDYTFDKTDFLAAFQDIHD